MTPSIRLHRGNVLVRDEVRFKVLSRSNDGKVNLLRLDDESLSSVEEKQILAEYARGSLTVDRRAEVLSKEVKRLLASDYSGLSDKARKAAEFRLPFIREMLNRKVRRWSDEALAKLIKCVRIEQGFKSAPCPRTLKRWTKRVFELGFTDCADIRILVPRNHACGGTHDRFGTQVQAIMDEVVSDLLMVPTATSRTDAYEQFRGRVKAAEAERKKKFDGAGKELKPPSKRTFLRRVAEISKEQETFAKWGKLAADKKHSLVGAGPQGDYLLHEVEVDHTVLDVIVVCPLTGEPIGRPTITVALDRWSRMIVGVYVGLAAAGWRSVMKCLLNAILPKDELLMADPEEFRAKEPWLAFGLPDVLVLDNGPEFHGAALHDAALEQGIKLLYCPAGKPNFKGKVERLFRRLNVELIHQMHGTTFSNPAQRANYDSKGEACFTVDQVRALVHQWIADIYCRKPHSSTLETPNARWEKGLKARGGVSLPPSAHQLGISLASIERRKLTNKGIELFGLHYSDTRNPQLREMLNSADLPAKVKVKFDVDNLALVQIEDWRDPGKYVPVPCTAPDYAENLTMDEHDAIMACARLQLKERQAASMDMLRASKTKLRAHIQAVRDQKKLTSRKANTLFAERTERVVHVGESGNSPPAPAPTPVAPRAAARPTQEPLLAPQPRRTFVLSVDGDE